MDASQRELRRLAAELPLAASVPVGADVLAHLPVLPSAVTVPLPEAVGVLAVPDAMLQQLAAGQATPELLALDPALAAPRAPLPPSLAAVFERFPQLFAVPNPPEVIAIAPARSTSPAGAWAALAPPSDARASPRTPTVAVPPAAARPRARSSGVGEGQRTQPTELLDSLAVSAARLLEDVGRPSADDADAVLDHHRLTTLEELHMDLETVCRAKLLPRATIDAARLGNTLEQLLTSVHLDLTLAFDEAMLVSPSQEDRERVDEVVGKLRVVQCLALLFSTSTTAARPGTAPVTLAPSEDRLQRVLDTLRVIIAEVVCPMNASPHFMSMEQGLKAALYKLNNGVVAVFKQFADFFEHVELNEMAVTAMLTIAQKSLEAQQANVSLSAIELVCALSRREHNRALVFKDVREELDRWGQWTHQLTFGTSRDLHVLTAFLLQLMQTSTPPLAPAVTADECAQALHAQRVGGEQLRRFTADVAGFLVERWLASKAEHHLRMLQTVVCDAVAALCASEWPAAELLLNVCVDKLLSRFCDSSEQTVDCRKIVIDLFGTVLRGIKSKQIKQQHEQAARLGLNELDQIAALLRKVFVHLQDIKHEHRAQTYLLSQLAFEVSKEQNVPEHVTRERYHTLTQLLRPATASAGRVQSVAQIPVEAREAMVVLMARQQQLFVQYTEVFAFVVRNLNDDKVNVRVSAMKVVQDLAKDDPRVLEEPVVREAVRNGLGDRQASVRLRAFETIAKLIEGNVNAARQLRDTIEILVRDDAVSVRKKAAAVLRDLARQYPDDADLYVFCAQLTMSLLADEEDSVRDEAMKHLEEMFLGVPGSVGRRGADATRNLDSLPAAVREEIARRARAFVRVATSDPAAVFLDLLTLPEASDKHQVLALIVESIVTQLLEHEFATEVQPPEEMARVEEHLAALVALSDVFAEVVAPHILRLSETFLRNAAPQRSAGVLVQIQTSLAHLCHTLANCAPAVIASEAQAKWLADTLESLARRMFPEVVREAVRALCRVSAANSLHKALAQVFRKNYDELQKEDAPDNARNRALLVCEVMAEHYDWDRLAQRGTLTREGHFPDRNWAKNVLEKLSHMLVTGAKTSSSVRMRALETIGGLATRRPQVMTDAHVIGLFRQTLQNARQDAAPDNDDVFSPALGVLNVLHKLLAAEVRLVKQAAKQSAAGDAAPVVSAARQDGSDVAQGLAQQFRDLVHDLVLCVDEPVRHRALETLSLVIDQRTGILSHLLPNVMAAAADPYPARAKLARTMLLRLLKDPGVITSEKIVKGAEAALRYQQLLAGAGAGVAALDAFYATLAGTPHSEKLCKTVLESLVKQFDKAHQHLVTAPSPSKLAASAKVPVETLAFIAVNLAAITYRSLEEPLLVVHHLGGVARVAVELHSALQGRSDSGSDAGLQAEAALVDCLAFRLRRALQLTYGLDERKVEKFDEARFAVLFKKNRGKQFDRSRLQVPVVHDVVAAVAQLDAQEGRDVALQLLRAELELESLVDVDSMLVGSGEASGRRKRSLSTAMAPTPVRARTASAADVMPVRNGGHGQHDDDDDDEDGGEDEGDQRDEDFRPRGKGKAAVSKRRRS